MIANSNACSITPPPPRSMFAQGNRIKGHWGARIHKTRGQESSQGGSATTNKFCQQSLHMSTAVGISWKDFFTDTCSIYVAIAV